MKLEFEYGHGLMSANLPDNTDVFIPGKTVPDPEYTKRFLAVFGKNLRDGFSGYMDDQIVRIDEFSAGHFGYLPADARLSAAGHADERDGLHIPLHFFGDHGGWVGRGRIAQSPNFSCFHRLRRQHADAAAAFYAHLFRLQHESRLGRVVNQIDHQTAIRKEI